MRKIQLISRWGELQGYALIDDEDFELVSQYQWHLTHFGYAIYKEIRMHRLIMNTPKGMDTDHVNENKLDNRKVNLRICTRSQNMANDGLKKNNTVGFKGVGFIKIRNLKKPWRAYLMINKKHIHLGYFETKIDGAKAYNEAALKYFGEFAKLNNV